MMKDIKTLADVERDHILDTLKVLKGDRLKTAHILGIGKSTLYRKLNRWGIPSDFGEEKQS